MVDLDKSIDMADVQANCRVALKNDSYKLHKILPNKVRWYTGPLLGPEVCPYTCMYSHACTRRWTHW